jgi:hypothetical protein
MAKVSGAFCIFSLLTRRKTSNSFMFRGQFETTTSVFELSKCVVVLHLPVTVISFYKDTIEIYSDHVTSCFIYDLWEWYDINCIVSYFV